MCPPYAPRITLHHAHLAHALGQSARAVRCYRVAADLADVGTFVRAAARAGEVLLRIGLRGGRFCAEDGSAEDAEIVELGREAVGLCRGMGGTLEAAGHLLSACLSKEIVKSKCAYLLVIDPRLGESNVYRRAGGADSICGRRWSWRRGRRTTTCGRWRWR